MLFLNKARKVNLLTLYDDFEWVVSQNLKNADLTKLVTESEDQDENFVKDRLSYCC